MGLTINTVLLGGHLTRDPEVKRVGEQAVANFGIAINHRTKGPNGEPKETVVFVDLEAWGRTAELVGQYLTKGSACVIEGRLKYDAWQDGEGKNRSKLKVVAEKVQFVGGGQRGAGDGDGEDAAVGGEAPVTNQAEGVQVPRQGRPAAPATAGDAPGANTPARGGGGNRRGDPARPNRPGQRVPAVMGEDEPPF